MVASVADYSREIADMAGIGLCSVAELPVKSGIPRVTSVISCIVSNSLNNWRANVGLEQANAIARNAAEFGTRMHRYIEMEFKNEPFVDPSDNKALRRLSVWRDWYARNANSPLHSELSISYDGPYCLPYRGTCDAVLSLQNGSIALADVKTSKSVHFSHHMQIAAYALALASMGIHVDTYCILHLTDDCLVVHEIDIAIPLRAFVAARSLYGALDAMGLVDSYGRLLT